MRAGELTERITIVSLDRTTGTDGQQSSTEVTYLKAWAKVTQQGGDQSHQHKQQQDSNSYDIELRSSTLARAITTQMRVRWLAITLHITAVDISDPYREKVVIKAEKRSPQG